jgi:hypothetical protein
MKNARDIYVMTSTMLRISLAAAVAVAALGYDVNPAEAACGPWSPTATWTGSYASGYETCWYGSYAGRVWMSDNVPFYGWESASVRRAGNCTSGWWDLDLQVDEYSISIGQIVTVNHPLSSHYTCLSTRTEDRSGGSWYIVGARCQVCTS